MSKSHNISYCIKEPRLKNTLRFIGFGVTDIQKALVEYLISNLALVNFKGDVVRLLYVYVVWCVVHFTTMRKLYYKVLQPHTKGNLCIVGSRLAAAFPDYGSLQPRECTIV